MKKHLKGLAVALTAFAVALTVIAAPAAAYASTVTFSTDQKGDSVSGRTFVAYKLFNTVAEKDNSGKATGNYQYTYASDAAKTNVVAAYAAVTGTTPTDTTANNMVKLIKDLSNDKLVEFAASIADANHGGLTAVNGSGNTLTADDGYYVVDETTDTSTVVKAQPFLLQIDGNKEVTLKSGQNDVDKDIVKGDGLVKYNDYNVGDEVPFRISTNVPNTYGYTTYTYTISDVMSAGLTVSGAQLKALTVKIGATYDSAKAPTEANAYTVQVEKDGAYVDVATLGDDETFTAAKIKIDFSNTLFIGTYDKNLDGTGTVTYTQPYAGQNVYVDLSATLNDSAEAAVPETNTTKLTYSNDSTSGGTGETPEHKVYVYTFGIDLQKSFSDKTTDYSKVAFKMTGDKEVWITGDSGDYQVVQVGGTSCSVEGAKKASENDALKLDDNGKIKITGLDEGTYKFSETSCPDGYTPAGDQTVTITATYTNNGDNAAPTVKLDNDKNSDGYVEAEAVNTPVVFRLPQTGEIGSIVLPIAGVVVVGLVLAIAGKTRRSDSE